jgi:hypothetical protein
MAAYPPEGPAVPLVADDNLDCSYNGFAFPASTTDIVGFETDFPQDPAGWTVAYVRYTITIRSVVLLAPGKQTIDAQIKGIVQKLGSQGGALVISGFGLGDMIINSPRGRKRDVMKGPRPVRLKVEPWGEGNVAEVEWAVQVCVPECDAARFEDAVMYFAYSVGFDIKDGYTTRRITGVLRIAETRPAQGNRKFRHTADEYRERVTPRLPAGFRRDQMSFELSDDKLELRLRYHDEEMGRNIPPPGVIRVKAGMRAHNIKPLNFQTFVYTLTATYDIARGTDPLVTAAHFHTIADDRKVALLAAQARDRLNRRRDPNIITGVVPMTWQPEEPTIFGPVEQARYTMTYRATFSVRGLLMHSFFRPVPGSDWDAWSASLKDTAHNARGQAGLGIDEWELLVIDLCRDNLREPGNARVWPGKLRRQPVPPIDDAADGDWIEFEQSFWIERADATYVHVPLPEPPATSSLHTPGGGRLHTPAAGGSGAPAVRPTVSPPGPPGSRALVAPPGRSQPDADSAYIVGQRCRPSFVLYHEGRAARVNSPVTVPTCVSVGSLPLVPANRWGHGEFVKWGQFECLGGMLHLVRWRTRYLVPAKPGSGGAAPNALTGEQSTGWDVTIDPEGQDIGRNSSLRGAGGGLPH